MEQRDYRLAAVMFTDIVGFSRMMERDEPGTLALVAEHNRIVTDLAAEYGGTVIKTVGDTFLLDFTNTVQAVRCAVAITEAIGKLAPPTDSGLSGIQLRIGIHLGDIYFFDNDAMGEGVNIAARLQAFADPGAICISQEVYNLVYNKVSGNRVAFRDLGTHNFKNTARTLHIYQVDMDRDGSVSNDAAGAAGASGVREDSAAGAAGRLSDEAVLAQLKNEVRVFLDRHGRRPSPAELLAGRDDPATKRALQALQHSGLVRKEPAESHAGDRSTYRAAPSHAATVQNTGTEDDDDRLPYRGPERGDQVFRGLGRILKRSTSSDAVLADEYRTEFKRRLRGERAGLVAHTASFLGVNAMLFGIWLLTGAGHPWFMYPLLGWGIGYFAHRVGTVTRFREYAEVEAMQRPTRRTLKKHRKLWRARRALATHTAQTASVSALLTMINIVGGGGFPWAGIPIGAMMIGLIAHRARARATIAELQRELGNDVGTLSGTGDPTGDVVQRAKAIRDAIVRQLDSSPSIAQQLGSDYREALTTYVRQVERITIARAEIERTLGSIPIASVEQERAEIERKLASSSNERIGRELRVHLEQLDRQRNSYSELTAEQEMLGLRATSALNTLTQLQIDLARAKNVHPDAAGDPLADLRRRSQDLSSYLEDLREGYRELER